MKKIIILFVFIVMATNISYAQEATNNIKTEISVTHNPILPGQMLEISSNKKIEEITIYNVMAINVTTKVRNCKINKKSCSQDISKLSNGVYFVKIVSSDGSEETFKIIKK